jgi:hypothetical protein
MSKSSMGKKSRIKKRSKEKIVGKSRRSLKE